MAKEENRVHCGLCKVYVDDWKTHQDSVEHRQKIQNLGGMDAIVKRRILVDKIKIDHPEMGKMAEKIAEDVDIKMENILTGKKGYNINRPDDLEKQDGFITPEGEWYSCDPVYHDAFAGEYLERFEEYLLNKNKKQLLKSFKSHRKRYNTSKDFLIDHNGWLSVTVGLTDVYMVGSKEEGITDAQKKMLKRWFLKYKLPFRINGEIVNDEFHDFLTT